MISGTGATPVSSGASATPTPPPAQLSRIAIGTAAFAFTILLAGCAGVPDDGPDMTAEKGCYSDHPLAERALYIQEYVDKAFADAPPLTEAEDRQMSRLAACTGGSALGVGDGCPAEWAEARASGLADRSRIRGAQYAIARRVASAGRYPDRSSRIRDLTVALSIANEAHETNAVRHATGLIGDETYQRTAIALSVVEGTLQDTIACEALR